MITSAFGASYQFAWKSYTSWTLPCSIQFKVMATPVAARRRSRRVLEDGPVETRGKGTVAPLVVVQGHPHLLEVVGALEAAGGFSRGRNASVGLSAEWKITTGACRGFTEYNTCPLPETSADGPGAFADEEAEGEKKAGSRLLPLIAASPLRQVLHSDSMRVESLTEKKEPGVRTRGAQKGGHRKKAVLRFRRASNPACQASARPVFPDFQMHWRLDRPPRQLPYSCHQLNLVFGTDGWHGPAGRHAGHARVGAAQNPIVRWNSRSSAR